ncbi:MAG: hypothetical protein LBT62_02390 [Deltaproteobacteria bacterium]|jgi:hypothetical protein|nr:hypothetical protein [Deltaproteobacteria bacterium]
MNYLKTFLLGCFIILGFCLTVETDASFAQNDSNLQDCDKLYVGQTIIADKGTIVGISKDGYVSVKVTYTDQYKAWENSYETSCSEAYKTALEYRSSQFHQLNK